MSETRATYDTDPNRLIDAQEERDALANQDFWLTQYQGLLTEAQGLETARAGVLKRAAAIRKRLGLEERKRER